MPITSPAQAFPVRASAQTVAPPSRRWLLVALLAAAPVPLIAQQVGAVGDGFFFSRPRVTLTLRGGVDRPIGASDIYDFTTTNLTLSRNDLAAFSFEAELGLRLSNRTELIIAGGAAEKSVASEFRRYVDNNDLPIQQKTALRRVPLTVGLRYALRNPEERIGRFVWIPSSITPWVGAGVGAMSYSFSQVGDFVDFQTLNVFAQQYRSSGWAPMGYANVGVDVKLNTRMSLVGDLRYTASRATLGGTFVGFNKIDLSGTAASMGITLRL